MLKLSKFFVLKTLKFTPHIFLSVSIQSFLPISHLILIFYFSINKKLLLKSTFQQEFYFLHHILHSKKAANYLPCGHTATQIPQT